MFQSPYYVLELDGWLAGCGSGPDCSLQSTPGGQKPKACVHEVPNGATITETDAGTTIVTLNGEVVDSWGPCPCPPAK